MVDWRVEKIEKFRKEHNVSIWKICKFLHCSKMSWHRWLNEDLIPTDIYKKRLQDVIDVFEEVRKDKKERKDE